jgi:predicted nucleic acid-binding protein
VILVLDSSALITLARIGRLDLLRRVAIAVHIPYAVYEEVVQAGQARRGSAEVAQAQWITRHQVKDEGVVARLRGRLGKGEAEAIVLARELRADLLVLDDATARHLAEAEGLTVVGLVGLLLHAKSHGLIGAMRPILDDMLTAGFFLDESLYRSILGQAGEVAPPEAIGE